MPFDGEIKPGPPPPAPADPNVRWSVNPTRPREPRSTYVPVSDLQALRDLMAGIKNAWAKQLNGPDNTHCIVGWVVNSCEPMTLISWDNPQTARLLQRLHDAMPKSAQRRYQPHRITLAAFNDARGRDAVYRVAERAYCTMVNELVAEANTNAPAAPSR